MPKNTNARGVPEPPASPAPPPAAQQPAGDADTRSRLIGAAVRILTDMGDHRLRVSLALVSAISRERGCMTPFENFLYRVGLACESAPVTPDDVRTDLEEFEQDFEIAAQYSRAFARQYPNLVVNNG